MTELRFFGRAGAAVSMLFFSCLASAAPVLAQDGPDPRLLAFIDGIRAIDNHSHVQPVRDSGAASPSAANPLGTSPPFFSARQHETNAEWIEAWRALYAYRYDDATSEHVRTAIAAKQELIRQKGPAYPASILDKAGIDVVLVNAFDMGRGLNGSRFRWVPYADGFLFPFPAPAIPGNVQQHRTSVGLSGAPPAWSDYLSSAGSRLREWKANGAVAVKFTIAYFRTLEFSPIAEADAKATYERYLEDGGDKPRDYRTAEYRRLQDFLFRHVVREAGRAGLAVHIHTGEGGGPVFGVSGSNPLLLESVLNDFSLAETKFVLVHGGFPFDRAVTALLQKPNVYADISGQTFFHSPAGLSETLRLWLWAFPGKVLFGTDAFGVADLRGWEEMTWIATRSGRRALALALSRMMTSGEITRPRAEQIARMVLRDNALALYKLGT